MAVVSESLWERGFQLSYFVLLDRATARECVARAIEKLAAQRTREKRRSYWRGRKKELTIRRISRPTEDTLQWLVCLESEACEKEQELRGGPSEADMVVRYVKHLAQVTTVNSSFHVNVGFNRLLRNYSTPEVQQVYELATERYPAAEEYRKTKGKLLNQLATRFEHFLKIRKAQYGELQFETHDERQGWSVLVEECLELFSPWSSHQSCLQHEAAPRGTAGGQPGRPVGAPQSQGPDRLETSRCHWFMHSTCYGRLVMQLGFDPPVERLSVPRFLHRDGGDPDSNPTTLERRTAPLSSDDTRMLRERVSAVAQSEAIALLPMRIVAHGLVRATLDPSRDEHRRFQIEEGTRLLELRSAEAEGDRILATHWIDYGEDHRFLPGEYTLKLKGRRQLTLSVVPVDESGSRAAVTVESSSASTVLAGLFSLQGGLLRPVLVCAALMAIGALISSAWFAPRISQDHTVIGRMAEEVAAQKATIASLRQLPKETVPSIVRYAFGSDAANLRGAGNPGEPLVSFAPGHSLVILELPVDSDTPGTFRVTLSTFPEQRERLSETALQPVKRGGLRVVEFTLPAALVEGNAHYLLELTRTGGGADARRYVFEVRK